MGNRHYFLTVADMRDLGSAHYEVPPAAIYNRTIGAWVSGSVDGAPLLMEMSGPSKPRPQSKKFSVETGEDLK